jgi:hypothetical protein
MTRERQEAIAVLQEFYDYNKTLTPHGESWLQADITINRETQRNLAEALPLAIEAMSRLLSDPETGLVRCGCGGTPEYCGIEYDEDEYGFYRCQKCDIQTHRKHVRKNDGLKVKQQLKELWNTAHGYKEDA